MGTTKPPSSWLVKLIISLGTIKKYKEIKQSYFVAAISHLHRSFYTKLPHWLHYAKVFTSEMWLKAQHDLAAKCCGPDKSNQAAMIRSDSWSAVEHLSNTVHVSVAFIFTIHRWAHSTRWTHYADAYFRGITTKRLDNIMFSWTFRKADATSHKADVFFTQKKNIYTIHFN